MARPLSGSGRPAKAPGKRGRPLNEAQAERIVDEAERHFASHGFSGMRMQSLSDALGVNKALLFHYFGSKQGLYDAVMGRLQTELDVLIEEALAGPELPRPMLHRLLDAYWSFLERRPAFARLMQWGYLRDADEVADVLSVNKQRFEMLSVLIEQLLEGDRVRARQAYLTLLGAMLFYWINPRTVSDVLGVAHDSQEALDRRRAHLHWLLDMVVDPSL